jgi:hypothetical protein
MYSNIANLDHKVGADRAEVHQLICGNILAGVDEERPEHLAWPLVDTQHEIIAVAVELDLEVGAFDVVMPWDAGLESHHLVVVGPHDCLIPRRNCSPQISAHRSACRHDVSAGTGEATAGARKFRRAHVGGGTAKQQRPSLRQFNHRGDVVHRPYLYEKEGLQLYSR